MARRPKESKAVARRSRKQPPTPDIGSSQESRHDTARVGRILRERARALARAPKGQASESPDIEILMFSLDGASYGLPTSFVREVVSKPKPIPLPRASDFLLGVCVVHGELLPLFDLFKLLESEPSEPSADWLMIVVGEKAAEFGLPAQAVFPSRTVPIEDILTSAPGSENPMVRGITPEGTAILDGRTLLSDPRLFL